MALFNRITTLALGTALLLPLVGISAAEGHDHDAHTGAAPILNTICPMDGKEVDSKAPTVLLTVGEGTEAKSFRLAMCSHACCTVFQKDPAPALKPIFGRLAPGPKTNFK
jgi:hypothetical protein